MTSPKDRWLERMIGGDSIAAIRESVDDALDHLVTELRGPAEAIAAGREEEWIHADFRRRHPTVMTGAEEDD